MTIFDRLLPLVYRPFWYIVHSFGKTLKIAFYAADPLDYEMFLPIAKHLDFSFEIIAKNRKTRDYLKTKGIPYKRYPAFPEIVVMGRHAAYKFPVKRIKKIGFDHGLYQFKRWTRPKMYNLFDIYFVSSQTQVLNSRERGIHTTKAIGYPKIDKAFNGEITDDRLHSIRERLHIDPHKKTIIFSTTWDVSGLSALQRWINRVGELKNNYNILLTAHTWTKKKYLDQLRAIEGTHYIDAFDITEYLLISDVFVGDYNSLIGEFCALNKPIITFKVPESDRTVPDVYKMIHRLSIQVDTFDEIPGAIKTCLENPQEKEAARRQANQTMFFALDGKAGERAAAYIRETLYTP